MGHVLSKRLLLITLIGSAVFAGVQPVLAAPGDDGHMDVSVDNWQNFYPKVTALRSLNAYLATDKGQKVYYIPKLLDLPNLKNAVSDCVDYNGDRKRFAAVYDGYFDMMCEEALVRKSDGTYSSVPTAVQTQMSDKARELQILGYDFLLTDESISNVRINGEFVDVDYNAEEFDTVGGYVDLQTALMDIYKAIGQEKYDTRYIFTPDSSLTVENSPIQSEISVDLSAARGIDNSDGKAWVFSTRSNPNLYWKQAANDGVVLDINVNVDDGSYNAATREQGITLAEFCVYAYNIMHIYGEPVMTEQERQLLMQVYGSYIPYGMSQESVDAISNFIAKGIISPTKDADYLNYTNPIDFGYMLTLLMRMADVNSRETFKDIQITMDATMFDNGYYQAQLTYDSSEIVSYTESQYATRYTNYLDAYIPMSTLEEMSKDFNTTGLNMDLFVPMHLVFEGNDGELYPLQTQVTTQSKKLYTKGYAYDVTQDGQLMQFCKSEGVTEMEGAEYLHLKIASFDIPELLHDDGYYYIYVVSDTGECSTSSFPIQASGGFYSSPGIREDAGLNYEEIEYDNQEQLDRLVDIYNEEGEEAALELLEQYLDEYDWDDEEYDAAVNAATEGVYLASTGNQVFYFETKDANSESKINVVLRDGTSKTLATIMSGTADGGYYYVNPSDKTDLAFRKINDTKYQVMNVNGKNDFTERVKNTGAQFSDNTAALAYCKQNEELMVSVDWLVAVGIINAAPQDVSETETLILETSASNVYLSRVNKYVVAGTTVYDMTNTLDENEIWYKDAQGSIFVNFRAVLGWAGDFMIFTNQGGTISVSIQDNDHYGNDMPSSVIKLMDIQGDSPDSGLTAQRQIAWGKGASKLLMSVQYPFANWFVYVSADPLTLNDNQNADYLFVFKPKNVKVNGEILQYDDSESRSILSNVLKKNLTSDFDSVTVWAYRLYREEGNQNKNPTGFTYSTQYAYSYDPPKLSGTFSDAVDKYFDTSKVLDPNGGAEFAIPIFETKASNVSLRCFNFNSYVLKNEETGESFQMDFGDIPGETIFRGTSAFSSYAGQVYTIWNDGEPTFEMRPEDLAEYDTIEIFPAVTSPALWFMDLNRYDWSYVENADNDFSGNMLVTYGTNELKLKSSKLYAGKVEIPGVDGLKFLTLTTRPTSIFSISQLNSFEFSGVVASDTEGTSTVVSLPTLGVIDGTVDNIDWDEFTMTRILQDFEFAIALAMVVILNLLPRVALFLMLLLIMLGSIQNVKPWQLFCVRIFDPYKLLTLGRRDVTTFRTGTMFRNSIIAMAVFALFMDGTILHVYEFLVQLLAYFVGMK